MRRLTGGTSGLLLAGILIYSLNLRTPITALPPVVAEVSADLHLTQASVGLLTGIPVLCFGILTPAAAAFLGRFGINTAITASLATVLLGTIVRSCGGFTTALVGTVLIGAAITVGNVSVPVIVARDFASSASTVTGLYVGVFNVGSALSTTLTAPLAAVVGWRWAVASWGLFAIIGYVFWRIAAPHLRPDPAPVEHPETPTAHAGGVLRRPLTWMLAIAFCGQAFGYYAITAWLPTILSDTIGIPRSAAGGAAALFQLLAIVGGVAVPIAAAGRIPLRGISMAVAACWLSLPLGLLFAPTLWPLWCSLAGVAQGGNFAVIFTLVATRAGSTAGARRMSAAVQTTGYACAATGPTVMGAVHTASGGWTAPLTVVLGGLLLMTALMAIATGRPREAAPPH